MNTKLRIKTLSIEKKSFLNLLYCKNFDMQDIMSVSEREQAEPIHRERRMAIVSFACDIIDVM
jgi:hypothetical protein